MSNEYLLEDYQRAVSTVAELTLVQKGAVTRCEHHKDVLLHNNDDGAEEAAFRLAPIWLKSKDYMGDMSMIAYPHFSMFDLKEAIKAVLSRATKDGCPECASQEDR